ncbi:MAG: hypothetical protein IH840_12205 [Candidatus Heimdallarchaeota archaeon]|nr:hypothetical protein [Candidatus Heimdallarchaeota archaeon]
MSFSDLKTRIELKVEEIRNKLYLTIMQDFKVSEDEKALVTAAIYEMKDLQQHLRFAFSEDVITQAEKISLIEHVNKVVSITKDIAESDEIITLDESQLLDLLKEKTNELNDLIDEIRSGI